MKVRNYSGHSTTRAIVDLPIMKAEMKYNNYWFCQKMKPFAITYCTFSKVYFLIILN